MIRALEKTRNGSLARPFAVAEEAFKEGGGRIRCAGCGRVVTDHGASIRVGGAHEHDFVNPAGIGFHVACFARAPGCSTCGVPTLEYTWFPGYRWSPAACAGCARHLGWLFEGAGGDAFFALITVRLAAGPGAGGLH